MSDPASATTVTRSTLKDKIETALRAILKKVFLTCSISLAVAFIAYLALSRWPLLWSATGSKLLSAIVWIISAAAAMVSIAALVEKRLSKAESGLLTLAVFATVLTAASRLISPTFHLTSEDFQGIRILATDTLSASPNTQSQDARIAKGIELSETDPIRLAQGKLALGKFSEAISLFDEAARESADELAEAHFYKARALWAMSQKDPNLYANALEEANLSLGFRPMYSPALVIKCISLRHLKKFDDALRACNDAVTADKTNEGAWNARGGTLIALGDHDGVLGRHYYDEALADLDIGLEVRGDIPQMWSNKALALHRLGRDAEALAAVNKALEFAPTFSDALLNKGTILKKLNRFPEAVEIYRELTKRNPLDAEAWNNLGDAADSEGNHQEALEAYVTSLQIDPDQPIALFNKGEVLNEMCARSGPCRSSEAVQALQGARKAMQNDPEVDYELAFALTEAGRHKEALGIISEALRLDPKYAAARSLKQAILHNSGPALDTNPPV